MTNSRKTGTIGLSIPVINHSDVPVAKMTTEEVIKWRAALPMADTGAAAKKLYIALNELNKTELDPIERFNIIELFRQANRSICTTLKRHYTEQSEPLTQQKLMIANLRQTLLTEMADNYKIILEDLANKTEKSPEDNEMFTTVICRILYYFNAILLCRYQLYSSIPEKLWQEIYILYKLARKNKILTDKVKCEMSANNTTTILTAYTKIILLSATDPYQWRQKEQYSINKAIDMWSVFPTILENSQIPVKKTGIYIIDLDKDIAPIDYSFKRDPITSSCIAMDLAKNVKHLKHLLLKIHNNELQAKIEHPGDPEFSVTISTITKLIKIWSQEISRETQRFPITAQIKVTFGLAATHFYVNNKKNFNPRPDNLSIIESKPIVGATKNRVISLPIFEIEDEDEDENAKETAEEEKKEESTENNADTEKAKNQMSVENIDIVAEKNPVYPVYEYNIENISPNGFCIHIGEGKFPPFQAGEIMAFKNSNESESTPWSVGAVRWIKSPKEGSFQIGIELVSPYAKAAGIQMLRDNQPAGLLLRCLIIPESPDTKIPSTLLTPNLPLHTNKVMLYLGEEQGVKTTLVKELEDTGSYHQYIYSTKENINLVEPKSEEKAKAKQAAVEAESKTDDEEKTNSEFDSIWKDL